MCEGDIQVVFEIYMFINFIIQIYFFKRVIKMFILVLIKDKFNNLGYNQRFEKIYCISIYQLIGFIVEFSRMVFNVDVIQGVCLFLEILILFCSQVRE